MLNKQGKKQNIFDEESAEKELQKIIDFWEVDPDGLAWDGTKKTLIKAIMKGRLEFDENEEKIIYTLVGPLKLANGETKSKVSFSEPTAEDLKVMDKFSENEKVQASISLARKMTGEIDGIIDRVKCRDFSAISAIGSLFF